MKVCKIQFSFFAEIETITKTATTTKNKNRIVIKC